MNLVKVKVQVRQGGKWPFTYVEAYLKAVKRFFFCKNNSKKVASEMFWQCSKYFCIDCE